MQRLYTIEVRVDFRDESKLPVMKKAIQQAARHVYSQAGLLGDAVKPNVIVFSHDFYNGHQDIALLEDSVLSGEQAITEAGNSALSAPPAENAMPIAADDAPISAELLAALKSA
jgi:hypothetical protein